MAADSVGFVQLDELEDAAPGVTAMTVKEAFIAIDGERRRLLVVERAETFVFRAALLQRHVLLNHFDDVGALLQLLDELLGV